MRLITTGMQMMRMLLVITLVMAMMSSVSCQSPDYVDSVFATLTSQARIKHVTVNKATGGVYVGAVNVLYQLSPQLDLLYTAETGPQQDNANCEPPASLPPPADWCGCHKTKDCELKETNSVTKSLVVDEEGKRLIVCFSLYQGYCEKRSLANIRDRDLAIYTAQVPNDATSSTVMFIAPGPQPLGRVLYVAAERSTSGGAVTSLSIYKDLVPAVCSRNLSSFSLAFQDFRSSTRKNVESLLRDSFRIHYVHGFASGDYSYFLMVQKDTVDAQSDANYGTHMARVCQRDDRYYSYTEIPLRCVSSNGTVYNLLRAAAVGHAGAELAQSLGLSHVPPLTDVDQVLVGVFSRSAPLTRVALNDSAVCLFTMRSVRSKFTATIQDCFQGKGNTGPPHIVQQQPCTATV
jgi:plexin A